MGKGWVCLIDIVMLHGGGTRYDSFNGRDINILAHDMNRGAGTSPRAPLRRTPQTIRREGADPRVGKPKRRIRMRQREEELRRPEFTLDTITLCTTPCSTMICMFANVFVGITVNSVMFVLSLCCYLVHQSHGVYWPMK